MSWLDSSRPLFNISAGVRRKFQNLLLMVHFDFQIWNIVRNTTSFAWTRESVFFVLEIVSFVELNNPEIIPMSNLDHKLFIELNGNGSIILVSFLLVHPPASVLFSQEFVFLQGAVNCWMWMRNCVATWAGTTRSQHGPPILFDPIQFDSMHTSSTSSSTWLIR